MYGAAVPNTAARAPPSCCAKATAPTARSKPAPSKTCPAARLALLRAVLRGEALGPAGAAAIDQALPHGHGLAALEIARRLDLDRLLPRQGPPRPPRRSRRAADCVSQPGRGGRTSPQAGRTLGAELVRLQQRLGRPRQPLRGAAAIGQAVGAVLGRHKMAKHFRLGITDTTLSVEREQPAIAAKARRDRI